MQKGLLGHCAGVSWSIPPDQPRSTLRCHVLTAEVVRYSTEVLLIIIDVAISLITVLLLNAKYWQYL